MKSKRIIALICVMALSIVLAIPQGVYAEQNTQTKPATQSGTPDNLVEVNVTDNAISYGTLNISGQELANGRTEGSTKYVTFESSKDLVPADSIAFNEGATNSNAFYSITSVGETYPVGVGLNSTNWIFLRDSLATSYVEPQLKGTLTNGGGGITALPSGVTEIGSAAITQNYFTSSDGDVTWEKLSQIIYIALGNDNRLYVGNTTDLSTVGSQYVTEKGQVVNITALNGNSMVLSSAFPTAAGNEVTFSFGYNVAWDATQGNASKSLYTLVDMPEHAATQHAWQWNLEITGEYQSKP